MASPQATSGKTVTGFVLGLIGFLIWWIPLIGLGLATAGFILGIITLKQTSNSKKQAGKGLSISAVVLGALGIVLGLLFTLIFVVAFFGILSQKRL